MKPCPICKRPAEADTAPFCSRRCADVDLRQWLTGGYTIPGRPGEDEGDGDAAPAPRDSED